MRRTRAIYQLKVSLPEIEPLVWRRIQVWEDVTLGQLHRILQIAMGWEDYHLHDFLLGRRTFSEPRDDDAIYERKVLDERRFRLKDLFLRVGDRLVYVYDFGDDWRHDLLLEAILIPADGQPYPCCIGGERRGPPEDVGGPRGYEEYLEALRDSGHEEHDTMLQWRGPFDPERLSLEAINGELRKRFRSLRAG